MDALPPVRSAADIASRLSDTAGAYPIFRNMTLTTLVLDGASGRLRVWCCGQRAVDAEPLYQWDLGSFWG